MAAPVVAAHLNTPNRRTANCTCQNGRHIATCPNVVCNRCGQVGHVRRTCPTPPAPVVGPGGGGGNAGYRGLRGTFAVPVAEDNPLLKRLGIPTNVRPGYITGNPHYVSAAVRKFAMAWLMDYLHASGVQRAMSVYGSYRDATVWEQIYGDLNGLALLQPIITTKDFSRGVRVDTAPCTGNFPVLLFQDIYKMGTHPFSATNIQRLMHAFGAQHAYWIGWRHQGKMGACFGEGAWLREGRDIRHKADNQTVYTHPAPDWLWEHSQERVRAADGSDLWMTWSILHQWDEYCVVSFRVHDTGLVEDSNLRSVVEYPEVDAPDCTWRDCLRTLKAKYWPWANPAPAAKWVVSQKIVDETRKIMQGRSFTQHTLSAALIQSRGVDPNLDLIAKLFPEHGNIYLRSVQYACYGTVSEETEELERVDRQYGSLFTQRNSLLRGFGSSSSSLRWYEKPREAAAVAGLALGCTLGAVWLWRRRGTISQAWRGLTTFARHIRAYGAVAERVEGIKEIQSRETVSWFLQTFSPANAVPGNACDDIPTRTEPEMLEILDAGRLLATRATSRGLAYIKDGLKRGLNSALGHCDEFEVVSYRPTPSPPAVYWSEISRKLVRHWHAGLMPACFFFGGLGWMIRCRTTVPIVPDLWLRRRETMYFSPWEERHIVEGPPAMTFFDPVHATVPRAEAYCVDPEVRPGATVKKTHTALGLRTTAPQDMWWILPTNAFGWSPARSDHNMEKMIKCRILACPPLSTRTQAFRWLLLQRPPLDPGVRIDWTKHVEAWVQHFKANKQRKRYEAMFSKFLIDPGFWNAYRCYNVELFVKTDELLMKTEGMKPRSIANVPPEVQFRVGPEIYEITKRLHQTWSPSPKFSPLPNWKVALCLGSGLSDADLQIWMSAALIMPNCHAMIIIAGDDSLVAMRDGRGKLGFIEGDFSMFDQSVGIGCLEREYEGFHLMGMSEGAINLLREVAKSPYVARFSSGMKWVIERDSWPIRDTGGPDTSVGNSYCAAMAWWNWFVRDCPELETYFEEVGFRLKYRIHDEPTDCTFLKGWWMRTQEGDLVWGPLPSRIVKVGKTLVDPRLLVRRGPDAFRRGAEMHLALQAAGLAPFNLGPLLETYVERYYQHGLVQDIPEWNIQPAHLDDMVLYGFKGYKRTIEPGAYARQVERRYGITEHEMAEMQTMLKQSQIFTYLEHAGFAALGRIDYG